MKSKIYPLPFALKHHDVLKKREDVFLSMKAIKKPPGVHKKRLEVKI